MSQVNVSLDRIFDETRRRQKQSAVSFTQNNPETTTIAKAHPISRIECRLTGNLVVGVAAATLLEKGGLNIIQRINLIADGKDVLFSMPGFMLQMFSGLYNNREPYASDPAVTVGTNAFEYAFTIPLDMGPNMLTLLDASERNELVLEVQWGEAADIATAGGGGTVAVTSVQLDVATLSNAGGIVGQLGGTRFGYPLHLVDYREIPIEQAQSDKVVDLLRSHLYSRICLYARVDDVASDAVINDISVNIDQSVIQKVSADQLQVENSARYNHARRTGWHVFDFQDDVAGRSPRPTHMLGVDASLPFFLTLDVSKPAGTVKIHMLSDRIARPDVTQRVR